MRRWIVLISALLAGCASSLAEPVAALDAGRLPEARAGFHRLEAEVSSFSRRDRTRYALYRGLTHLALGDARAAERWLGLAKRALTLEPGLLAPAERGRLLSARRSMGRMAGE